MNLDLLVDRGELLVASDKLRAEDVALADDRLVLLSFVVLVPATAH